MHELPAVTSGLSSQFVELSVNESEQSLNLQEVTLKFSNLSISMQGQIKISVLISVVKTLEEVCCTTRDIKIYLCTGCTDMRKGIKGVYRYITVFLYYLD